MRLTNEEFALFKKLSAMLKAKGKLEGKDLDSYNALLAKRQSKDGDGEFKPGNDFSWWNKEPELLGDAVNIKQNYIPGREIDPDNVQVIIPGVLGVDLLPAYGVNAKSTDPINIWARDLYLRMFQKWRGISAYSSSDLGITLIAGVEIAKAIAKAERIYGIVNRYSKRNVNIPGAELMALGLTRTQADYIRNHMSDYRYDLNMLIKRAQRICIPRDMSILSNHLSLFGYEYLDHDNIKAQIIMFDTKFFGLYSDTRLESGGSIEFEYHNTASGGSPFLNLTDDSKTMFPVLDALISGLVGSDGVQKIFGDLVTWFGEDQMVQFKPLPEDFVILPVYSESILHKLHNSMCLPTKTNGGEVSVESIITNTLSNTDKTYMQNAHRMFVYQSNDSIVTTYAFHGASTPQYQLVSELGALVPVESADEELNTCPVTILDSYHYDITPETVTEGLLWKYHAKTYEFVISEDSYRGHVLDGVGFELVRSYTLYKIDTDGEAYAYRQVRNVTKSANDARDYAGELSVLDWAPITYVINSGDVPTITGLFGDLDVLVPIYGTTLIRAMYAVVLSGFKTTISVLPK